MAIRERVIRNMDYEAIKEPYQNHNTRETYFYASLIKRLYIIGNTTSFYLPRYTIEAQSNIQTNDFDQLVLHDICLLLLKKGILPEEALVFCQNSFHGSFKKGILSLVNDYIQTIKNFDSFIKVYGVNDTVHINQQIEAIKQLINTQDYEDFMFSYYFYHNTLLIYYNAINDYYKGLMDGQMTQLYLFLILSSICCALIYLGLSFYLRNRLRRYYLHVALTLSLIPYDRLINDEQMKFLINNFLKKI